MQSTVFYNFFFVFCLHLSLFVMKSLRNLFCIGGGYGAAVSMISNASTFAVSHHCWSLRCEPISCLLGSLFWGSLDFTVWSTALKFKYNHAMLLRNVSSVARRKGVGAIAQPCIGTILDIKTVTILGEDFFFSVLILIWTEKPPQF